MEKRYLLNSMRVADVWQLVVQDPTTIEPEAPLYRVLEKTIEDQRTRHVYVVDASGKLVGSVRMTSMVALLFPFEAISAADGDRDLFSHVRLAAGSVRDVMNKKPKYVTTDTSLNKMARILIEERINELPVVDEDMRLIGQVNMYEVIAAYLRARET